MKPYKGTLELSARKLRANMTDAEQLLWRHVRGKQIHGVQFNRQKPILKYIVDFYCARARLVIEIDGGQHFELDHQNRDEARDRALSKLGLLVLRFDNHQMLTNTDSVLESIYTQVENRLPH